MAEVLNPITNFKADMLTVLLQDIVLANEADLNARRYSEFFDRFLGYSGLKAVERLQERHQRGDAGYYVIQAYQKHGSEAGSYAVIGLGAIEPNITLHQQTLPTWPLLAGLFHDRTPYVSSLLTHRVIAYTDYRHDFDREQEETAYRELIDRAELNGPDAHAWATVPIDSYHEKLRTELENCYMGRIAVGRFLTKPYGLAIPPLSGLYVSHPDVIG